jgi:hypothetical protein
MWIQWLLNWLNIKTFLLNGQSSVTNLETWDMIMCCTSQGAVVDEYGAMVDWWLGEKTRRNSENDLLEGHLIYHESRKKSPGTELEVAGWESSS